MAIEWSRHCFHPVVVLPSGYEVLDFTTTEVPTPSHRWSVGRYDEDRRIYTQELFGGARTVHVGVDLGGPEGTAVHAFADGEVLHAGYNPAHGDYGHVVVTAHRLDGVPLYALHGHLSAASLGCSPRGRRFAAGDVLGWLGGETENGGWPPHVHFQLSWDPPETHDLPGAVARSERDAALRRYPDPRRVLGMVHP